MMSANLSGSAFFALSLVKGLAITGLSCGTVMWQPQFWLQCKPPSNTWRSGRRWTESPRKENAAEERSSPDGSGGNRTVFWAELPCRKIAARWGTRKIVPLMVQGSEVCELLPCVWAFLKCPRSTLTQLRKTRSFRMRGAGIFTRGCHPQNSDTGAGIQV